MKVKCARIFKQDNKAKKQQVMEIFKHCNTYTSTCTYLYNVNFYKCIQKCLDNSAYLCILLCTHIHIYNHSDLTNVRQLVECASLQNK